MRKIPTLGAKPGTILVRDIFTSHGQKIAKAGTKLDAQLILRLRYYNIDEIAVAGMDEPEEIDDPEEIAHLEADSLVYRIKTSEEFKNFKKTYYSDMKETEALFQEMVVHSKPANVARLSEICNNLFENSPTGIGLMNMLLCLRDIDDTVFAHSVNSALTARVLGKWLGYNEKDLDLLTLCGLLHDIGKAFVPSQILNNPKPLSAQEIDIIRQHCEYGYNLLSAQENLDELVALVAYQHHERANGSGYPLGLTQEEIHPFSSIVAIADAFDAMTSSRIYRAAICPFEVIAQFEVMAFDSFDPLYTTTFLNHIVDSYIDAQVRLNDGEEGIIVKVNPAALTRPLLRMLDGSYLDLNEYWDLYIEAVV